jgi:mono/diheme cytochrome c family protein
MKTLIISIVLLLLAAPVTAPAATPADAPADALANARMDFNAKCSSCHRATSRILQAAKQLNVDPKKLTLMTTRMSRDEIIAITETGKNKMPAFEKELSRERIEAIADYVLLHHKRKNRDERKETP